MKKALAYLFVVLSLIVVTSGCGNKPRVIPAGTLSDIYVDLFLADQWIRDNNQLRKGADTTLYYEPVFRKYGYTTRDYQKSVEVYLMDPEKYAKILEKSVSKLDRQYRMLTERQKVNEAAIKANSLIRGYVPKDFSSDSLAWADSFILWPKLDSIALDSLALDSLAVDSLSVDSLALDSIVTEAPVVDSLAVKAKKKIEKFKPTTIKNDTLR